jgi:methylated-DNA-[protein]-cysteine S-methyltransferase
VPAANTLCVVAFDTDLGWAALAGSGTTVKQLVFGHASRAAALAALDPGTRAKARNCDWWPELVERLEAYAAGAADDFRDVELDLAHLTPFARRVVVQCRQIGYGRASSYGELAVASGRARAARAVGNTMAGNRFAILVPCHRVTHSGGDRGRLTQQARLRKRLRFLEANGGNQAPRQGPKRSGKRTGRVPEMP